MSERKQLANIRLTGALYKVASTLQFFRDLGWEWNSIKSYEPSEEAGQFDYSLQDVTAPLANSTEPAAEEP